jgi:hypothetical protein
MTSGLGQHIHLVILPTFPLSTTRQQAIDTYNRTPQVSLGGRSPHELVYGRGVSTQLPESSSIVPERFHQGREFLSVTRNVTVRESKRPKARSQDQDYQRRSSMSPSIRPSFCQQFPLQNSGMDPHLQIGGGGGGRSGATPSRNMNCTPPTPASSSASSPGENPLRSPGAFAGTGAETPREW